MKLVVGLGNPGRRYAETRHNVGFAVLAELARRYAWGPTKEKFHGEVADGELNGQRVLLLWPLTYMNHSGRCVRAACDFYQLDYAQLLVVCDDFQLPLGRLRFRASGSSGGQKGLDDIIRQLGSSAIARLRIGVGPLPPQWDPAAFVLGRFAADEQETADAAIRRAADGVAAWVSHGTAHCMNHFNAAPPQTDTRKADPAPSKEKDIGDQRL